MTLRKLIFGVFENVQANDSGTAVWRHPDHDRLNFERLEYWTGLANACERASLDFIFLADAWGWSEIGGQRPEIATLEGLDLPRLDPFVVASALIATTRRLGFVITGSTLLEQPYPFTRRIATLDHLSNGRIGWNIVTTGTAETAVSAFGMEMVNHDKRYDMADDFMELAYKLFEGAWEPDAIERNRSRRYADPDKVHRIVHDGPYFQCDGYGNTARSPQGSPVLFQAGSSPRGTAFAGRHAECVFLGGGDVAQVSEQCARIRAAAVAGNRRPDAIKVISAMSCVVAKSTEEAHKKRQSIVSEQNPDIAAASYAMFTGLDLRNHPPDTPMSSLATEMSQTQILRHGNTTVREVLEDWYENGVRPEPLVGTGNEIADTLIAFADDAEIDGFVLTPLIQPMGTLEFVNEVLPELDRRGARSMNDAEDEVGNAPRTLRESLFGSDSAWLGLDHPGAAFREAAPGHRSGVRRE